MSDAGVTRRLAALLSADVAGYSRLMAADEQATIRTITAYRKAITELVEEHRGRVVDTPGDNILAEFPTALDAVEAGVEIQDVLQVRNERLPEERRMEFRIGVHLGDISVQAGQLYGDGVNIAARLEGLARPGGVCVSAEVHGQVRHKLAVGFEDLGEQEVKNLPEPVHAFQIRPDTISAGRPRASHPAVPRRRRMHAILLGVGGLALGLAFGVWATWPRAPGLLLDALGLGLERSAEEPPSEPSLVVLPFATLGEEVPRYLAAGIAEDLMTDLFGIPDLLVVSRNSAFAYQGPSLDLQKVGRELGVRYAVQGTVRGVAARIRVTVALTDTTTGVQIWSNRYDRVLADVLDLQSEISEEILATLNLRVEEAELARIRRKATESLTAYEALKRANSEFYQFRRDANERARALYQRAIELDPGYADAYALMANTYNYEYTGGWNQDPVLLERAEQLVLRALELDPLSPEAFASLTAVHIAKGRWAEAVLAGERCVELAPSYDFGIFLLGMAYRGSGRPLMAFQTFRRGLRLDPRGQAPTLAFLADLNYRAGRVKQGVALWERVRRENPHHIATRLALAQHYEREGRLDEARAALREILRTNANYQAERARGPGGRFLGEAETRWLANQLDMLRAGSSALESDG